MTASELTDQARTLYDAQSDETKAAQREAAGSAWKAWWMAWRCRKNRQRASDICYAAEVENGNGNANGNGNGRDRSRAASRILAASQTLPPQSVTFLGNGVTTTTTTPGAEETPWYMNPLVWVAGAGAAFLFLRK